MEGELISGVKCFEGGVIRGSFPMVCNFVPTIISAFSIKVFEVCLCFFILMTTLPVTWNSKTNLLLSSSVNLEFDLKQIAINVIFGFIALL